MASDTDCVTMIFRDRKLYDRAVHLLEEQKFRFFATTDGLKIRIPTDMEGRLHISIALKKWGVPIE